MKRRIMSFKHAFDGIFLVFKNEANFRIEFSLGVLAVVLGFILNISPIEWAIVLLLVAFVLSAELLNSIIEKTVSCLSVDSVRHDTKDIAAGFVLILSIAAAIIGLIIFLPKILIS